MSIWDKLFGRQEPPIAARSKAVIFVDYEHWYYSYKKLFYMVPDPAAWKRKLDEEYDIEDVMIFADFGHDGIQAELPKLRTVTNTIIETQNAYGRYKKDMTDFIMLDYIYQTAALKPEYDTYILFTGDGHFQSVVKYLVQRLKKKVIVYGVEGATSNHLKSVATTCIELPEDDVRDLPIQQMIIQNMSYTSRHSEIIPTFMGTVQAVSRRNEVPEHRVKIVLQEMLDSGLVYRKDYRVDFNRKVKVIAADWEKLHEEGLWEYE